ncbi:MAG: GNAT family N-acetyltransferase [Clostridia bacterium]|nr:GNAT family N-acetyltransferase [Clostridia bacterium]
MLTTERLILRPFEEGDAAALFAYWQHPTVHCFVPSRLDSMEQAVERARKRAAEREYCFAVVLKETGEVIGEVEAYPESGDPHNPDAPRDTFSPCWMLHPARQGRGYALEATRAFLDYLFRQKGARRVYAYVEEDNLPGQRLCERLGMRREGLFLEFVSFVSNPDGSPLYENTMQYALLRREWPGL